MAIYPELQGRVALITGGASGLGWAAAQSFARQGVHVAIADLHAEVAQQRARNLGEQHIGLGGDVASEADVQRIVSATGDRFGRIDILVNSAGIPDSFKPTVEQDVADFRRLVDVHLTGTYMMSKAVVPWMLRHASGSIINLSSIAGVLGLVRRNAYSAAKAGISMMTRTMGCEWAAQGIRVNAIAPGYMLTPFAQKLIDEGKLDADRIRRRTPAGRLGTAQHIADAMVFLASDQAAFITGVTLPVDGGYMAFGAAADAFSGPLD
ncbi:SDR family NAD(P)-dependent oxidoreductase [Caldimonas thermodepolymerans]|uniref:SDR family NAD(P)-dependent oxidoreductase n=1 Tax=Caldimonas thermodepolymerans TaxID=215580 RepID=UPI002235A1B9|nr:glucose 1-dehydrogenase [Caldimonas thermodepolymerans]UZG44385.1 glucose 1-dehydrogenase [Caldimonas thermodepolymerans]